MGRSAVITGLGVVSAYGLGMDALWEGLCSGTSALSPIESFDAGGFPAKLGGEAPGVRALDCVPKSYRKAVKVMARDTEIAVVAASLAVAAQGDSLGFGTSLLFVYAAGLGIPFLIAALAAGPFIGWMGRFRRHLRKVEMVVGGLLVSTGLLFIFNYFEIIGFYLLETFPVLAQIG